MSLSPKYPSYIPTIEQTPVKNQNSPIQTSPPHSENPNPINPDSVTQGVIAEKYDTRNQQK